MTIAQHGKGQQKGVVRVPKDANGEGWLSISRVFQAVVNSFVAGDKARRQMVDEGIRQVMTYT